jgi:hypothetical protein
MQLEKGKFVLPTWKEIVDGFVKGRVISGYFYPYPTLLLFEIL